MLESRIILALDGLSQDQLFKRAEELRQMVGGGKVNDALDDHASLTLAHLRQRFSIVMADPKIFDIPNTAANRASKLASFGATWITVHALGGEKMMAAAVEAAAKYEAKILAVTVLTSISDEDCFKLFCVDRATKVIQLAISAANAGAWGVVCSPQETATIRHTMASSHLKIINPGIRLPESGKDDQKAIGTPTAAILAGADYLVVGRPITEAADPVAAAEAINKEVEETLASMQKCS